MGNDQSGGDSGGGGGGGGDNDRDYTDCGSFGQAFASAHNNMGPGHTFDYNGNSYTTDRADGRDMSGSGDHVHDSGGSGGGGNDHGNDGGHQHRCGDRESALAGALHSRFVDDKKDIMVNAARGHNDVKPEHLAAIASRESQVGKDPTLKNGIGDNDNGYGDCQVDKRSHTWDTKDGPGGQAHYNQAAGILQDSINAVRAQHPNWSNDDVVRGGIAAYNVGVNNVRTVENMGVGTTGNNYSRDVCQRAEEFKNKFE